MINWIGPGKNASHVKHRKPYWSYCAEALLSSWNGHFMLRQTRPLTGFTSAP